VKTCRVIASLLSIWADNPSNKKAFVESELSALSPSRDEATRLEQIVPAQHRGIKDERAKYLDWIESSLKCKQGSRNKPTMGKNLSKVQRRHNSPPRKSKSPKTSPWNVSIAKLYQDEGKTILLLQDEFPKDRIAVSGLRIGKFMEGRHTTSMFPHVYGVRVYVSAGMKSFSIDGDSIKKQVFLHRRNGQTGPTGIEELFGLPRVPIDLFSLSRCCLGFDENLARESLDVTKFIDFDGLPVAEKCPEPEGMTSLDEDLALNTEFCVHLAGKKSTLNLSSKKIDQLKAQICSFCSTLGPEDENISQQEAWNRILVA